MDHDEFEWFVHTFGTDIMRFCRMTAGSKESGNELYQDTMLKLLEKKQNLSVTSKTKSYALSIALLLWKNRKKKYAVRSRIVKINSIEAITDAGGQIDIADKAASPEEIALQKDEEDTVRRIVAGLPEKYRILIYLYYSADMGLDEIAEITGIPKGTVKSRMHKARKRLKPELEAVGYDR